MEDRGTTRIIAAHALAVPSYPTLPCAAVKPLFVLLRRPIRTRGERVFKEYIHIAVYGSVR